MSLKEREATRRSNQSAKDREAHRQFIQSLGKHPRKWVSDQWLADYFEVARCTIWRWVKIGKLPPPQKIGPNCTRWDVQQILATEECA